MDDRSFDRLARLLGEARDRRTGLKALVGGILGAGTLAALDDAADAKRRGTGRGDDRRADDAEASKKKKKQCKPACTDGHVCRKVGKKRECVCPSGVTCGAACCALGQSCIDGQCRTAACDPPCANGFVCQGTTCACPSGVVCGEDCCASGQTCENGACAGTPEPEQCVAAGQACKAVGRACCDGRVCSSGQGGEADVACYVPKTGRCASTSDCVFGTSCVDGRCTPPPPAPPPPPGPVAELGAACDPAANVCTSPGAVCQPYTGDVPAGLSGTYCTLPLGATCTVNPDCGCYSCDYQAGSFRSGRRTPRADRATTCCGKAGISCSATADCCEDHVCTGGSCQMDTACTVCKDGSCLYDTIQDALDAGVRDIRVGAGTYFEHDLEIPDDATSLRIRACSTAKPTIIDAGNQGRIMEPIPAGTTVTIQGITVRNGKVTGNGGGFDVGAGGALVLDRATVTGCRATAHGGGIHVDGAGAKLTLTGATVSLNSIESGSNHVRGGGIYLAGSGAALTITDSLVSGNSITRTGGQYADGGGIYVSGGEVEMIRTRILANRATGANSTSAARGGGIHIANYAGAVLVDCAIENNVSSHRTGGLYVYQGGRGDLSMTGGTISGNDAADRGGGVYLQDFYFENQILANTITFDHVEISANRLGSANTAGCGLNIDSGRVNFTGSTAITNNGPALSSLANVRGGGVTLSGYPVVAFGKDTVVAGNTATGPGGGVFVLGGTLTFEGAIRNNTSGGDGGGLYSPQSGVVTVKGKAVISGNTAAGNGGGIWNYNELFVQDSVEIRGNTATGDGGGIHNTWETTLDGTVLIRDNTAASGDGVLHAGNKFTCVGTPRVCANPGASGTQDNCSGTFTALCDTSTVCAPANCPTAA